jgi:hypothetical protein
MVDIKKRSIGVNHESSFPTFVIVIRIRWRRRGLVKSRNDLLPVRSEGWYRGRRLHHRQRPSVKTGVPASGSKNKSLEREQHPLGLVGESGVAIGQIGEQISSPAPFHCRYSSHGRKFP